MCGQSIKTFQDHDALIFTQAFEIWIDMNTLKPESVNRFGENLGLITWVQSLRRSFSSHLGLSPSQLAELMVSASSVCLTGLPSPSLLLLPYE